jgi:hypothetical protein
LTSRCCSTDSRCTGSRRSDCRGRSVFEPEKENSNLCTWMLIIKKKYHQSFY